MESNGVGADITGTIIGLIGRSSSSGWPLWLTDSAGKRVFSVSGTGDIAFQGGLFQLARIAGGAQVRAFSPQTTLPTVEETGTGQVAGGVGIVRLDPVFAASIDRSSAYRVFLTPNGDTHGLFVAQKTANGFIVRESQGGRATVSFDYRIVATALGHAGQRMALADAEAGVPKVALPDLSPLKLPSIDVAPPALTRSARP